MKKENIAKYITNAFRDGYKCPHINVLDTKPRFMKELPHSVVAFRQVKIGGDFKIIISSLRKGKEKSEK